MILPDITSHRLRCTIRVLHFIQGTLGNTGTLCRRNQASSSSLEMMEDIIVTITTSEAMVSDMRHREEEGEEFFHHTTGLSRQIRPSLFFLPIFLFCYMLHLMHNEFITSSSIQTKKLGQLLAEELRGGPSLVKDKSFPKAEAGVIICLSGDLGAGKTTFTQGLLKGLGIKGPYTSPTFAIIKHYQLTTNNLPQKKSLCASSQLSVVSRKLSVYHIDAYRITSKDLLELGFKDFAGKENSVTIIEWPEKVKKIIPTSAVWINFEWLGDQERKITFSKK